MDEVETHASQPLQCHILFLHDDRCGQPAEVQVVGDYPGIDPVGLVQVGIGLPEPVDKLWINREHLGFPLLKRGILMQIHGRMPAIDRSRFQADMDFRSRQLVRSSDDAVAQMRGTVQIVFDFERFKRIAF